jgi:hypothetical protein
MKSMTILDVAANYGPARDIVRMMGISLSWRSNPRRWLYFAVRRLTSTNVALRVNPSAVTRLDFLERHLLHPLAVDAVASGVFKAERMVPIPQESSRR